MVKSAGLVSSASNMFGRASEAIKAGFANKGQVTREVFAPSRKITVNADKSISTVHSQPEARMSRQDYMAKNRPDLIKAPVSDRAMNFMANSVDKMQGVADKVHDAVGNRIGAIRDSAKNQFTALGAKVKGIRDQAAAKVSGHFISQPNISPCHALW